MISAVKDTLQAVITQYTAVSVEQIVRSAAAEKKQVTARAFPVVGLITADGKFREDIGECQTEDGTIYRLRGHRTVPVQVRIWDGTESGATNILHDVMRNMPVLWQLNGVSGTLEIKGEQHSDHITAITQYYVCSLVVECTLPVYSDEIPN